MVSLLNQTTADRGLYWPEAASWGISALCVIWAGIQRRIGHFWFVAFALYTVGEPVRSGMPGKYLNLTIMFPSSGDCPGCL